MPPGHSLHSHLDRPYPCLFKWKGHSADAFQIFLCFSISGVFSVPPHFIASTGMSVFSAAPAIGPTSKAFVQYYSLSPFFSGDSPTSLSQGSALYPFEHSRVYWTTASFLCSSEITKPRNPAEICSIQHLIFNCSAPCSAQCSSRFE